MPVDVSAKDKANVLQHLTGSLHAQYGRTSEKDVRLTDLNKSIKFTIKAVEITPDSNSVKVSYLKTLADYWQSQYITTKDTKNLRR